MCGREGVDESFVIFQYDVVSYLPFMVAKGGNVLRSHVLRVCVNGELDLQG